jgi:hypothetical protein
VVADHAALRQRFPEAEIRASTLDAFARVLAAAGAAERLPTVTAEIGDPWIFGAGSDPMKVSAYRDLLRARRVWRSRFEADGESIGVDAGTGLTGSAGLAEERPHPLLVVDRSLLLVAEHTWGLDQKTWLPDTTRWDRPGLEALRDTAEGRRFEDSWAEQRHYVDQAADALQAMLPTPLHHLRASEQPASTMRIADRTNQLSSAVAAGGSPVAPEDGFVMLEPGTTIEGGAWLVTVDPGNGAVCGLVEVGPDRVLADPDHPLGLLRYQSFDAEDYDRFYAGLTPVPEDEWWARWDNTKPGIDVVPEARSGLWDPVSSQAWHATTREGTAHDLRIRVEFAPELSTELGAPPAAWIRWFWTTGVEPRGHSEIEVTTWWVDKPASRLPEALWFSFVPAVAEPERWTMEKLGQQVSPLDVVRHGGRSLHGVGDGGLSYHGTDGPLRLRTVDAALVAPGRPNLLDADPPLPDMAGGWHVLLADNCWGTNFPMWIEGGSGFRFDLAT